MYNEPIQRVTMRFPKALLRDIELFAKDNPWIASDRSKAIHYLCKIGLETELKKKGRKRGKTARDYYEEALNEHLKALDEMHNDE